LFNNFLKFIITSLCFFDLFFITCFHAHQLSTRYYKLLLFNFFALIDYFYLIFCLLKLVSDYKRLMFKAYLTSAYLSFALAFAPTKIFKLVLCLSNFFGFTKHRQHIALLDKELCFLWSF
jgi:hypothetical protein